MILNGFIGMKHLRARFQRLFIALNEINLSLITKQQKLHMRKLLRNHRRRTDRRFRRIISAHNSDIVQCRACVLLIARFDHLLTTIHTCLQVNVVATLCFTCVAVFNPVFSLQSIVCAAHIAL